MNASESEPGPASGVDAEAAAWVVRHERGLTAAEQDAFLAWLAGNSQHRAAFAEQRWSWEELDRLSGLESSAHAAPDDARRAPAGARPIGARRWIVAPLVAAGIAAAAALVLHVQRPSAAAHVAAVSALALCEQQTLADGSQVDLNRGAAITVQFTATERRVRLDRGEAHFAVAKDPLRPFVVEVEGVAVRAVGTAFSVKRGVDSVAVLVTEGTVTVASPGLAHGEQPPPVTAGQKAVASLSPRAPATVIEAVAAAEMEDRLAWKPRLLEFDEAPLAEIAAEFNRRNPVRIEIADPALRARRLSATLRSDNVEGFVRMLESDFGVAASRARADVIALQSRR
jgi:transmembrane sensor